MSKADSLKKIFQILVSFEPKIKAVMAEVQEFKPAGASTQLPDPKRYYFLETYQNFESLLQLIDIIRDPRVQNTLAGYFLSDIYLINSWNPAARVLKMGAFGYACQSNNQTREHAYQDHQSADNYKLLVCVIKLYIWSLDPLLLRFRDAQEEKHQDIASIPLTTEENAFIELMHDLIAQLNGGPMAALNELIPSIVPIKADAMFQRAHAGVKRTLAKLPKSEAKAGPAAIQAELKQKSAPHSSESDSESESDSKSDEKARMTPSVSGSSLSPSEDSREIKHKIPEEDEEDEEDEGDKFNPDDFSDTYTSLAEYEKAKALKEAPFSPSSGSALLVSGLREGHLSSSLSSTSVMGSPRKLSSDLEDEEADDKESDADQFFDAREIKEKERELKQKDKLEEKQPAEQNREHSKATPVKKPLSLTARKKVQFLQLKLGFHYQKLNKNYLAYLQKHKKIMTEVKGIKESKRLIALRQAQTKLIFLIQKTDHEVSELLSNTQSEQFRKEHQQLQDWQQDLQSKLIQLGHHAREIDVRSREHFSAFQKTIEVFYQDYETAVQLQKLCLREIDSTEHKLLVENKKPAELLAECKQLIQTITQVMSGIPKEERIAPGSLWQNLKIAKEHLTKDQQRLEASQKLPAFKAYKKAFYQLFMQQMPAFQEKSTTLLNSDAKLEDYLALAHEHQAITEKSKKLLTSLVSLRQQIREQDLIYNLEENAYLSPQLIRVMQESMKDSLAGITAKISELNPGNELKGNNLRGYYYLVKNAANKDLQALLDQKVKPIAADLSVFSWGLFNSSNYCRSLDEYIQNMIGLDPEKAISIIQALRDLPGFSITANQVSAPDNANLSLQLEWPLALHRVSATRETAGQKILRMAYDAQRVIAEREGRPIQDGSDGRLSPDL